MPTKPEPRSFADFLGDQRHGLLHAELGDSLRDLVDAVTLHGKAGTLTLVVKVSPAGKNSLGVLTVSDTVKVKKPEGERAESIFFADSDHNLHRNDPNQLAIEVRELDGPKEPRDAAA